MKQSWNSTRSSRYAVVRLGACALAVSALTASALTASALPASAAAFAARTTGSPHARGHFSAVRSRLDLSVLPVAGRVALALPTKTKELFGVFCNSAKDCWAVGESTTNSTTLNQVQHWTGRKWLQVKVPNPAGTAKDDLNELFAIRCTSAKNCWAVGDMQNTAGELDQALHYNGKSWALADTPSPGGTGSGAFNTLDDVACTSAKNCWAVGTYGLDGNNTQQEVSFNQVVHFDGRHWTFRKSPSPGGKSPGHLNQLNSVRCTTPTTCWAVGTDGDITAGPNLHNEILFSNGTKWSTVKVPNPSGTGMLHVNFLNSLACTAKADCWAVGVTGDLSATTPFQVNEALHWNGGTWTAITIPNLDAANDELLGVTCINAHDCWAVGDAGSRPGLNESVHWDGKAWSLVHAVNGGGKGKDTVNTLAAVRCISHSNCWAVGRWDTTSNVRDNGDNQILQWNGTNWRVR